MSAEERIIRPYVGVERLGRLFNGSFVQMTAQQRVEPGKSTRIGAREFLAFPVQLWLARDENALEDLKNDLGKGLAEAGLDPSEIELVAVMSTTRLKLARVHWRRRADDLDELEPSVDLSADPRPDVLRTPFGGCRIDLYALLSEELEPAQLKPWRRGTWLSHAGFEIKTDLGDVGFTPLPLTDLIREQLGLPAEAVRYAVVDDPFADASSGDTVQLYIDEELLNQLALQPSRPAAKSFQRQMFIDAMTAIVREASKGLQVERMPWGDVEETLLGRLLKRLAGTKDKTSEEHRQRCEDLLRDVRESPALIGARIEAIVPDLRKGLVELLRGENL